MGYTQQNHKRSKWGLLVLLGYPAVTPPVSCTPQPFFWPHPPPAPLPPPSPPAVCPGCWWVPWCSWVLLPPHTGLQGQGLPTTPITAPPGWAGNPGCGPGFWGAEERERVGLLHRPAKQ